MPGTLRSTSRSVVAPCCSITALVMTLIVCGMSRSGSVYFGEATDRGRPVTSTNSDVPASSSVTASASVNRKPTAVPVSSCLSACSAVNRPDDARRLQRADHRVGQRAREGP